MTQEPICDQPARAQKEKVTLHLTPVSGLALHREGRSSQKDEPYSPQRQTSSSKENLYWSLCQGEVGVEEGIYFYNSLLLKRKDPRENTLGAEGRWGHWIDSSGRMLMGVGLNYSIQ